MSKKNKAKVIVTRHARERIKERLELRTKKRNVLNKIAVALWSNGIPFGAQRGNNKLLLCHFEQDNKDIVLAGEFKKEDNTNKWIITTALTPEYAQANIEMFLNNKKGKKT